MEVFVSKSLGLMKFSRAFRFGVVSIGEGFSECRGCDVRLCKESLLLGVSQIPGFLALSSHYRILTEDTG